MLMRFPKAERENAVNASHEISSYFLLLLKNIFLQVQIK